MAPKLNRPPVSGVCLPCQGEPEARCGFASRQPGAMPWAVLVLFCGIAMIAASGKATMRVAWASPDDSTDSIPAAWKPRAAPPTTSDVRQFERFCLQDNGLCISNLFARYGLPNRDLTTQQPQQWDFAIYDLPSRQAVALYVPKPPADRFGAFVIMKPDGDALRLIK